MAKSVISMAVSSTFSLEEHQELGIGLKVYSNFLSSTSYHTKKSFADGNAIKREIGKAQQAIAKAQQLLHSALMNDFQYLPDSELLPIYLGRLDSPQVDYIDIDSDIEPLTTETTPTKEVDGNNSPSIA